MDLSYISLSTEVDLISDFEFPRNFDRKNIHRLFKKTGEQLHLDEDLIFGLYNFFVINKQFVTSREAIRNLITFLYKMKALLHEDVPFKARSFSYPCESNFENTSSAVLYNAEYCLSVFGRDLFMNEDGRRRRILSVDIEGTDFVLTCKGGNGTSTFSIEFAIALKSHNPANGEIWRAAMDFESSPEGASIGRIISMGGAYCENKNGYEEKNEAYKLFYKKFRLRPQRTLIFLLLFLAYDLNLSEIKALSTVGAKEMSLLNRSREAMDYSYWLSSCGFSQLAFPNWLYVCDLQRSFYDVLSKEHTPSRFSLMAHETDALDAMIDAFNKLNLGVLPLRLCSRSSREELQRVFTAFYKIHKILI
ncbi:MAG: hypothetical protein UR28_C0039G0036 [Candidatus Peregrinibacteria bacterium GW2011_GWF2_33_10]|nr:MAG: hypothetical protein UR28_C0039G0036 [Candidatus Peregrinibacteria bacterium GW2011_GWF2_33_10]OGJ45939.1 MAG: hypothetical protein A2263_02260 [Candidatus Peregrinibacteria bacterium RIFOXYA2_FULL_33_21]OGJ46617.1 MAG: hypothetical protein A2272_02930 [Candidatus Peregrinibacteria bacterium RIFOXYA12_FULL_33_12]OGJ51529.1 MAG: hypothetical protein A2307_01045 [Candidatus Peregrinibacteria bacterium RIFOXYB2_FULL_33_20]